MIKCELLSSMKTCCLRILAQIGKHKALKSFFFFLFPDDCLEVAVQRLRFGSSLTTAPCLCGPSRATPQVKADGTYSGKRPERMVTLVGVSRAAQAMRPWSNHLGSLNFAYLSYRVTMMILLPHGLLVNVVS